MVTIPRRLRWVGFAHERVRFASAVYALHCFQKKSVSGITTPKPDLALIEARLKAVMAAEKDAKR